MTVYIIEGWFGDVEWIEGIYTDEAKAEEKAFELRKTRRSERDVAEWIQGLAKFAVIPHQVIQ